MADAGADVVRCDCGQGIGNGELKSGQSSGACPAQQLFEFRPAHFDGVEIWRVSRKVVQSGSSFFDELAYAVHFVGREIVHHDYVSGLQLRTQHLFEEGQEDIAIGSRFDRHGGHPSGSADGSQYGQCAPVAAGDTFADSLPAASSTLASGHLRCYTALIEEDQLRRIDLTCFRKPVDSRAAGRFSILFGGMERLFFSVRLISLRTVHKRERLTSSWCRSQS